MKPKAMTRSSRPPLERMLHIHKTILSGACPTASRLAAELEVSAKSIHRDLEFMRDRLRLPLKFDRARFGYLYTEEVGSFPSLQITEGELVALVVAEKALQQYRGTAFEKPLLSAIGKMREALPDTISVDLGEIERAISFRTRAEPILALEILDQLARAAANRESLEISYRKPGQPEPEPRAIDPYHLANINGEWFLFAFDHLRKGIRTFVPGRIKSCRKSGRRFKRIEKFSLEDRLRGSFGVRSGEGDHEVRIRFDPSVADYIREKRWHHSQQLREFNDGSLELRLKLSGLAEVERWVLNWGGKARALQPPELVESIARAACALVAQHHRRE